MGGVLIGVGVGPGDPELLTLRALQVLQGASRVIAPTLAIDAAGRAETVVREAAPDLRVERLVFPMAAPHPDGHTDGQTDPYADAYETAAARLCPYLDAGEEVAFVTLGDPNVYSTFSSLAAATRRRRPATRIRTIPGIMAFQDLAARAGQVLLGGTERLALVTALDGTADLDVALADPDCAVVVYKGGRHLPEIAKRLADAGRLDGALLGELLGLPGQRLVPVADAPDAPATYLASVIVPPASRRASVADP